MEMIALMFNDATAFNQDISGWDISRVGTQHQSNAQVFMTGATAFSTTNYDLLLNAWSLQSVLTLNPIHFESQYTIATSQAARDILTNAPNNWVINDGGGI